MKSDEVVNLLKEAKSDEEKIGVFKMVYEDISDKTVNGIPEESQRAWADLAVRMLNQIVNRPVREDDILQIVFQIARMESGFQMTWHEYLVLTKAISQGIIQHGNSNSKDTI